MTNDLQIINAEPTKELFIEMLVRDIPLTRAIIDLVDNSVDSATRLQDNENYHGLWIKIEASSDSFAIEDNCGGMSIEAAREYAFKFGRDRNAEETPKSIGRFGIGMKRAFFKLGKKFTVESTTLNSRFVVSEDVEVWKEQKEWTFRFQELTENIVSPAEEIGTKIIIENLHEGVAEDLGLQNFLSQLKEELRIAYSIKIQKGLSISINSESLEPNPLNFRTSEQIKIIGFENEYTYFGSREITSPVKVKLYAGVSDRDYNEGGWYIFCNERMVLEADQTEITGWGSKRNYPKYHPDFAFFRGYAFFESDDAANLPWTTTKTGVDYDSPVYKTVKSEIYQLTAPVLHFLRRLADEKSRVERGEIPESLLEKAYSSTSLISVINDVIEATESFEMPEQSEISAGERHGNINYSKPIEEINLVKELLDASSNREVGIKTFEYYLMNEG